MHCFACDKTGASVYDAATKRYYCQDCIQPTIDDIMSRVESVDWRDSDIYHGKQGEFDFKVKPTVVDVIEAISAGTSYREFSAQTLGLSKEDQIKEPEDYNDDSAPLALSDVSIL